MFVGGCVAWFTLPRCDDKDSDCSLIASWCRVAIRQPLEVFDRYSEFLQDLPSKGLFNRFAIFASSTERGPDAIITSAVR